ncbi:MaoC/PaaZ C-terminal domain-containing protein [Micromonospora sp. NPDC049060]|uniref:MaoC/PaaZ C-terminal domain-containing protein n=1 Tax=Micromonospora sp. NPDC049060 TaxID=3154828 RepID=UPI0033C7601A
MNTQDKRAHAAWTQPPPTAEATGSTTLSSQGSAGVGRHPLPALVGLRTSRERAWTPTETILYALGVGAGQRDPAAELRFTTENSTGHPQRVLPTFASVLAADPGRGHRDPAVAGRAGLPRPILHGLCTFGFAGRLLLPLVGDDPTRVRHVRVRFAAPLHPGDTLTVHAWRRPYGVVFRATDGTGRVVLDRGVLAVSAR